MALSKTRMNRSTIVDGPADVVHRFTDHTCVDGPHTISMAPLVDDEGYLAAVGPVNAGTVDLYSSTDAESWRPLSKCRTFHRQGIRWPSVLTRDGRYYVSVRGWEGRSKGASMLDRITGRTVRHRTTYLAHRAVHAVTSPTTSIQLLEVSSDFSVHSLGTIVPQSENGNQRNQNPFLFETDDGAVALIYYSGDEGHSELRLKVGDDPTELSGAKSRSLLESTRVFAAPSCCVDPVSGDYLFFAELKENGRWKTIYYRADSLSPELSADTYEELYTNDVACPFPFITNETLYLGLARKHSGGIIHRWTGEIHRFRS